MEASIVKQNWICSLDVARYVFKNMAGNMPNSQTKSARNKTTDLG